MVIVTFSISAVIREIIALRRSDRNRISATGAAEIEHVDFLAAFNHLY